ncbi:MAG: cell division/cell wall cluster transcriptional repressor MraZ, partial [Betaproteobacteria bacterium]
MFRGVTHLALDNKGRLAIPARHREGLARQAEGRLVLTADPGHCLLLYPLLAWEPIEQRLMALSSFNEKIR